MPIYMVERTFAEAFDPDGETMEESSKYLDEKEIRWITSFLSADKKRSYCLYEADDASALIEAAEALGLP